MGMKVFFNETVIAAHRLYSSIPGSYDFTKYVMDSYQHDPYRVLVEVAMFCFMMWYFLSKKTPRQPPPVKLTTKEVDELCHEWVPEELVPEIDAFQKEQLDKLPITVSQHGLKVKLLNDQREKLNFSSYDFLGIMNSDDIKDKAIVALRKYGVGTCGPRGFYGTIDVHLELEDRLAKFTGAQSCIIYSQNYSTVSSAIPAFAKRGDTVVADDACSLSVQVGLNISRSNVHYFKHNDMGDLARVLEELHSHEIKKKKKLTRKFIVVEGIYLNTGDMAPLRKLVKLKEKYKYRLIVDESLSFGVLGDRGAGLAEHFGMDPSQIDIMVGSLTNSLAAGGGFVAGSNEICEHQRLSGQAYTFSASLPAMLAVSAIEALRILQAKPVLLQTLRSNVGILWNALKKNGMSHMNMSGGMESSANEKEGGVCPVIYLRLKKGLSSREEEERLLQDVVDQCLRDGLFICRTRICFRQEKNAPLPGIRICVSAGFTRKEVEKACSILKDSLKLITNYLKEKEF